MSSICNYTGQLRKLRELAINELGADKVVTMGDSEIASWVEDNFAIFWGDSDSAFHHEPDHEIIVLIPNETFSALQEKGAIKWIER